MAKSGDTQLQQQTQNGVQNQTQTGTQQQTGTTDATQVGTRDPYAAAQPLLQSLINQYSSINPGVTGAQSNALGNLSSAAGGVPNFGDTGADAVRKLFSSSTDPQVGMLTSALQQLQGNIGGVASGAELDPYKTPGFSDAINTMTNDITNRVKGVYAGSGRDPSGAGSFAKSLGRGLTEGIAPTIAGQFNQNNANRLNAANTLFSGAGSTAGAITGQQQVPLTNAMQGLNSAGMLSGLYTNPAMTQLAAANAQQQQPQTNLAGLLQAALGLGGAGGSTTGTTTGATTGTGTNTGTMSGTSSGNSNTTVTQPQSLFSNIMGGLLGGAGLLSSLGPTSGAGSGAIGGLSSLFALSDERAKENIEKVGSLDDGETKVYRYNYKGDPRMQIGLLAQEIEDIEPDAVRELPDVGLLAVNYRRATDRAAAINRRSV